jgi:hypothetical protein
MPNIDPVAAEKIQLELLSVESIYWAARPNPSIVFRSDDWYTIPFSLLLGGFAIFWDASVLEILEHASRVSTVLWRIPFVVMGPYMIWGRFFADARVKAFGLQAPFTPILFRENTPHQARALPEFLSAAPGSASSHENNSSLSTISPIPDSSSF